MDQERSILSRRIQNTIEILSMTWVQFVKLIYEFNERCSKFVDSDGRHLLFAIKKGTADTLLWKITVRICVLNINARSADSCRVLTLEQFVSLQQSLYYLLKDAVDDTGRKLLQKRFLDIYVTRALVTSECTICMERKEDVVLPCVHTFCSVCIDQWKAMKKNCCPLCRNPFKSDGSDTWAIPDVTEGGEPKSYLISFMNKGHQS